MDPIIETLAKEMNLSPRTIYRALRNEVSEARPSVARRAEAIRRRAGEIGYRTNGAARSIREGNFKQMMLVTARLEHTYAPTLSTYLPVLSELLLQRGCHLALEEFLIDRRTGRAIQPRKLFQERSEDGIFVVISSGHFPPEMELALAELGVPLVWLNHQPALPDACCVISDETRAINEMVDHLAELDHRRIAFLTVEHEHYSTRHRREELERAARRKGLELAVIRSNEAWFESSIRKTAEHFLEEYFPRYTAAVCFNREFMNVLRYAAGKRGISIPGELSVCHFISLLEHQTQREFPLSGVLLSEEAMAREALRRMDRLAAGKTPGPSPCPVEANFIVGESTART